MPYRFFKGNLLRSYHFTMLLILPHDIEAFFDAVIVPKKVKETEERKEITRLRFLRHVAGFHRSRLKKFYHERAVDLHQRREQKN